MGNAQLDPTEQRKDNHLQKEEQISGLEELELDDDDELTEEDFDFEGEEEGDFDDSDYDEYDSYGTTGEKYGWYNGWSDDVIDDAFEGDPENTWNVD